MWECTLPLPDGEAGSTAEPFSVHRLKGRLLLDSGQVKMVQGVREVFEVTDLDISRQASPFKSSSTPESIEGKLVLIGRGVADQRWEDSLKGAVGSTGQ